MTDKILDIADLTDLKPGTRVLQIKHPKTKENIGVAVTLCSLDDDRMKGVKKKILERRLYLEARGKTFKADEIEENQNDLTFASIVDWNWYGLTYKGSNPELTRKNVMDVFKEYPLFAEQINEEIGDTRSFFGD